MRSHKTILPRWGIVWLAFTVALLTCGWAAAAEPGWFYRLWQTEEGLPNNTVTGLAQTPDGYLWVATPVGLARFDGARFEEYSPTNFAPLPNRGVIFLCKSAGGGLWLAMDRGALVHLNQAGTTLFTASNGLPATTAQRVVEDIRGAAWISYRGGTVCRIADGQVATFGSAEGVPRGQLNALAGDGLGRVWVGDGHGLFEFADGRFQLKADFPQNVVSIVPARNGGLWVCGESRVFKYDGTNQPMDCGAFDPAHPSIDTAALLEDHTGAVWVGTIYGQLLRYNGAGFEKVRTSRGGISSLTEDDEGNLWVGTGGGGLNRVRIRAMELENEDTGAAFESVESVSQGPDGTIWAVTHDGRLMHQANGAWSTVNIPGGGLTCVAVDGQGAVWLGTQHRQVHCWREGRVTSWGAGEGLEGRTIHSLLVASNGDVWVSGGAKSVQRFRDGKLSRIQLDSVNGSVRTMIEDGAGNIWIGTARGALVKIHDAEITVVSDESGPPVLSIRCLYAATNGDLWIGYAGGGLGRWKDGKITRIQADRGLYDNFISQIVDDGHGWLWCGSDRGIFRVRLQALEDACANGAARVRSTYYGPSEGLPGLQATVGLWPCALRDRTGKLWMPMRTGLVVASPDKLSEKLAPPPVLLNRISVDGRTLALLGGLVRPSANEARNVLDLRGANAILQMPPAHRRVDFDFTALSFSSPENVHFRYKLDGYDEAWTEAGDHRSATYPRLAAGNYRFQVTACSSDGVWSETGAGAAFEVTPFFWQTWWFRVGALAAFTSLCFGVGRYVSYRRLRTRLVALEQQTALDRERARIARDIHDDLGTRLSEITLLSAMALEPREPTEKVGEHVRQITEVARQVTDSLDEIVWAVNPRNDTLPHVISYLGQFAMQFMQMAHIRCHLELPDHPPKHAVSAEARHNLFMVSKEALNNIVRHAHASEAWLKVQVADPALEIVIEDNGRGFEPGATDGSGDGLRNMRQRMTDIGGECRVESKPAMGTRIVFIHRWSRIN